MLSLELVVMVIVKTVVQELRPFLIIMQIKSHKVKKWNAVALWAWDIVVDNCAICRY